MICNSSLTFLSLQYSFQPSSFFILPVILINSRFSFNFLTYKNIYSPFINGFTRTNLFVSNSQFSYILSPAIHLSNEKEIKILRDLEFHEKNANITSDISLINCTFTYCTTSREEKIHDGGTIAIRSSISLEAKYCTFRNNEARRYGGAISAEGSYSLQIDNCLFAENTCQGNGALSVKECDKAIVKRSNFTLNKSKMSVGAIYLSDVSKNFDLSFCALSCNQARLSGTLHLFQSHGNVDDCLFYYNKIKLGPLSIRTFAEVVLKIQRTTFSEERSPSVLFSSGNEIEIRSCRFGHSQHDEISNENAKLFVSDDNVFDSKLPFHEIILPPLKPLYDNEEDFKIVENERKKTVPAKNKNKTVVITDAILPPEYSEKEVEPPPKSVFKPKIIFLIAVVCLFLWYANKRTQFFRGFNELHKQNNSIFNDDDINYNPLGVSEMTDVKFQLNDNNDFPNLRMEKF